MNNRNSFFSVIFTVLFLCLTTFFSAFSPCHAQSLSDAAEDASEEEAPKPDISDCVFAAVVLKENMALFKANLEMWRQTLEEQMANSEHEEFKKLSPESIREQRGDVLEFLVILAIIYLDDDKRADLYDAAQEQKYTNLKTDLLQLYQQAVLFQTSLYAVHCKWQKENFANIGENNELALFYRRFLFNWDITYKKTTEASDPVLSKIEDLKNIEKQILQRRALFQDLVLALIKDLETGTSALDKSTVKAFQEQLIEKDKIIKGLHEKLNSYMTNGTRDKIKQVQAAGKGTVDIDINGQSFRFVYVSPGTYYIGNDEENSRILTSISGRAPRKQDMYEIQLDSGFFIMEDKITPEQLKAISKYQSPNEITWKQAMESADLANQSLGLTLNNMTIRLPSVIEWECAVRGKESKNTFPWGNNLPGKSPDDDVTELGIKHAASYFSEWCIDKQNDNYGFNRTIDKKKLITYFPNNGSPCFTYYCVGDSNEHQTVIDIDQKSLTSFRIYKGASEEDFNKKNYQNRAVSNQRNTSADTVNPNISFRFVLIPESTVRPVPTTEQPEDVPAAPETPSDDAAAEEAPREEVGATAPGSPVKVTINGEEFTFIKCPKCESFEMPINFIRSQGETIEHDFYIMDTELTIAQYEALRELNPDLPSLDNLNKNCNASARNSSLTTNKNKPIHGIVPLEDKGSSKGLRYANMVCETLTSALNSGKAKFDKSISGSVKVRLPAAIEWYYAAVAVDDPGSVKSYCHLGTIKGRDYMKQDCLSMLLDSQSSSSLESIQTTYMKKYWKMLWDESELSSDEFKATPNQIVTMIQSKDVLKLSDPNEKIGDIVKLMPLTYFRCLLYNKPIKNSDYLFESAFTAVKSGEEPNNWGLYDVHSNVSELVLDSDRPVGYSIMGGQNNLSLDSGWQDNWQRYLLWKKISPNNIDQYNMPGLRLIFTIE